MKWWPSDDDDAALTCVGGGAKAALGAIEAIAKQFEANRAAAGILERLEPFSALEKNDAEKSERLDRMELQIESLSHNLSGVADDAARRAARRRPSASSTRPCCWDGSSRAWPKLKRGPRPRRSGRASGWPRRANLARSPWIWARASRPTARRGTPRP